MKNIFLVIALSFSLSAGAQQFKRYQVKSGKMVIESRRFMMVRDSSFSNNGPVKVTGKDVPYVAEKEVYYWDDYGDVARDTIYKVSEMGGKPLQEKKIIIQRLWKEGSMYYSKNDKVSFDPYHLREQCMEHEQLFRKVGWFKILYPNVQAIGKEKIVGKEGVRKGMQSEKIAVELQTGMEFKPGFFNPLWYQKFTPYYLLDADKIGELMDGNPDLLQQAETAGLIIHKGETLTVKFVPSKDEE